MLLKLLFLFTAEGLDTSDCFGISCVNDSSILNCINVNNYTRTVGLVPCSGTCNYSSLYLPNTT